MRICNIIGISITIIIYISIYIRFILALIVGHYLRGHHGTIGYATVHSTALATGYA